MLLSNWRTDFFQACTLRRHRNTHKRRTQSYRLPTSQLIGQIDVLEDRTLLAATVINVDTFDDLVNAGDNLTSLREAICQANITAGDFEIVLAAGTYTLTIAGAHENSAATGDLDVLNNGSVVITGGGADLTTITANGLGDRVWDVFVGASLTLDGLTITGGSVSGNYGGGIQNSGGNVVITGSTLSGNSADFGGGIMNINSGHLDITSSTFSGNASLGGGGIYNAGSGSVLTITDSIISTNSASTFGAGGVYNAAGVMTITGSTLSDNSASSTAGGIRNTSSGSVTIRESFLTGNSANGTAGGILNVSGSVVITGSTLSGNSASDPISGTGGGIFNSGFDSVVTITATTLSGNSAFAGGGIYNQDSGRVDITGSSLSGNLASSGGGIRNLNSGSVVAITGSTLSGNSAGAEGGGIFNSLSSSVIITGSTLFGNLASSGGGIYNTVSGRVAITGSTLSGNSVNADGGGINNASSTAGAGSVVIMGSTLYGNSAGRFGSGLFTNTSASLVVLQHTIIAGNVANEIDGFVSSVSSFNLIGDPGTAGGLSHGTNGNILGDSNGSSISVASILNTTLADNGGPTLTHALVGGSPAINAGDPNFDDTNLPYDQRGAGFDRVVGNAVDIGAIEWQGSSPANGSFVVTNTNDSGAGSLRQAILAANANNGPDTIVFNIATTDPGFVDIDSAFPGGDAAADAFVFQLLSGLPALNDTTGGTTIDGRTQTSFSGNTNPFGPEIILDGSSAPGNGLAIYSDHNFVFGLDIRAFSGSGIEISGGVNNWVAGNFIGTDATGTQAVGNGQHGVLIVNGGRFNHIGTNGDGVDDASERNLISGNGRQGVYIFGEGNDENTIAGNFIGTDGTGRSALGNGTLSFHAGVTISGGAQSNIVGTNGDGVADEAERNLISGNTSHGIAIADAGTEGNIVAGNYVGTDVSGSVALSNGRIGISISSGTQFNVIGTNGDGLSDNVERNVISGNKDRGIYIMCADYNTIAGNYIGSDGTGSIALANGTEFYHAGITIATGSKSNLIGTDGDGIADDAERNLISGNIGYGVLISGAGTDTNVVAGNYVGTDGSGMAALPNSRNGIAVSDGARFNVIGTNADDIGDGNEANVVAGNLGANINITNSDDNTIAGNMIGTDRTGTAIVNGPAFWGVRIGEGAQNNHVGGASPAARNIINGHTQGGVTITGKIFSEGQEPTTGNRVQGNFIGLALDGSPLGNVGSGVFITDGATGNLIGTDGDGIGDAGERNVISANTSHGVEISGDGSDSNVVAGNLIGTDALGKNVLGNAFEGVRISNGAKSNLIGTNGDGIADTTERNVISGNRHGVYIVDVGSNNNTVAGNHIGTDASGTVKLGNSGSGVLALAGAQYNVIGTNGDGVADAAERNIVSGNGAYGVILAGSHFNTVSGNYIGTNSTGEASLANGTQLFHAGILVSGGSQFNCIGTNGDEIADDAERNIISGNSGYGVLIQSTGTNTNVVAGNYIGTNASGAAQIGNGRLGVAITNGAQGNVIGTNGDGVGDDAEHNVISGNAGMGVLLTNSNTSGNRVAGNFIGINAAATSALGNEKNGVMINNGAQSNIVGTNADGVSDLVETNRIAFNRWAGIAVSDAGTTGNSFRGNATYSNGGLGIDLAGGTEDAFGATANDIGDLDAGPNNLQNFPELTKVVAGSSTRVLGSLNAAPKTSFVIDLYANTNNDPSGYGEGQTWLTSFSVLTDATGNVSFDLLLSVTTSGAQFITATATDPNGNTSEFSHARETVQELFGTPDNDHFLIEPRDSADEVKVTLTNDQGQSAFVFTSSEVFLFGLGGDDTFIVNGLPAGELYLDGGDQDEDFQVNATDGGHVTVLGHIGDDVATINATSTSGASVDLGDGDDDYFVNFGQIQGSVTVSDSGTSGKDKLDANGTGRPDRLEKTSGTVTHEFTDDTNSPTTVLAFENIENVTVRGAAANDLIIDPGTNTTLLGGPGDDTIMVTATFGNGLVVNGEEGADTIEVQLGLLSGPVSIEDSGTVGTTTIRIIGTVADEQLTLSSTQLTSNGEIVNLNFPGGETVLIVDGGEGDDLITIDGALPAGVTTDLISIAQTVQVDVKPASNNSTINLASNGVIPVVIYSTADFDTSTVDVVTVLFAGASVAHYGLEDIDGDGDLDLVLQFRILDTDLEQAYIEALLEDLADGILDDNHQDLVGELTGRTVGGREIEGMSAIDAFFVGKTLQDALSSL